jgi:hypothetical protein
LLFDRKNCGRRLNATAWCGSGETKRTRHLDRGPRGHAVHGETAYAIGVEGE